ncbi:MAG: phospholipase D-like domain-containing protein [Phycisphaerales bacterium]|nr:phospholipase D-like domain-containing protein [Phycisphaerales bacterium]
MSAAAAHPRTLHLPADSTAAPPLLPRAEAPRQVRVDGHDLTIFVESAPLVENMLADILAAKSRVWLEVYIFANDASGRKIADALKRKAAEGLDVRLLYDAVGCAATPRAFFNDMAQAGVRIHEFHSLLEGLRRFRLFSLANIRNHRKLLVIDDVAAYFGGMNLIDNGEALKNSPPHLHPHLPISAGWRDVHLRLAGPQQPELADSFDHSWRKAHGEKIPRRSLKYRRAMLRTIEDDTLPKTRNSKLETRNSNEESIHFFDSGPGVKYSRAARIFTRTLKRARRSIIISMAYFIPVGSSLRALFRARRRKVRVRIIVPGQSDVPIVQRATSYLYDRLVHRGMRIYERRHRMLHSKVVIVDDTWTIVGSANLDPRSLYINLEFLAVIRSPSLARIMTDICRFEISQSQRITSAHCHRVPWYHRFINSLAWSLRWWL